MSSTTSPSSRVGQEWQEEMARQEIRNRLGEADKDVWAYKRIAQQGPRRSPQQEGQDTAWKSFERTEAILRQLEGV